MNIYTDEYTNDTLPKQSVLDIESCQQLNSLFANIIVDKSNFLVVQSCCLKRASARIGRLPMYQIGVYCEIYL